jgi:hypothetical protein
MALLMGWLRGELALLTAAPAPLAAPARARRARPAAEARA